MLHTENNLSKKELHGIFYGNPFEVVNKAWENRANGRVSVKEDRELYVIPYPNAGHEGGYGGEWRNLNYVTIVVKKGTNKLITAFPGNGYRCKKNEYMDGN